ncbi:MAG: hypothetical protein Q7S45_02235 [Candidatus Curtissbacteria bacterium]|nr:hypothetical protein [Candidatus Curtissbacteria bacterium]
MKQETRNKKQDSLRFQVSSLKLKSGQILVITVIFLAVILILSTSLFTSVTAFLKFGSNSIMREQAVHLAEAGIDKTLWQLNQTAGTYTGETNTPVGTTGTFTVAVTDKSPGIKTITATGFVPNAAAPKEKQIIKVDTSISSETISFRYAVQVGAGGVNMENSSQINGNVYSNGNITGSGTSKITGDAYAVETISSPDPTVLGTKYPNQPPSIMPTIDYQYWKDAATAGGTTNCGGDCSFTSGFIDLGPKKFVGNLILQNTVYATMNGPIYVTGNVDIKNSAVLKLNNNFGSNGTVIISDGKITVQNGGSIMPTDANPKGYIMAVSTSTNASEAIDIKNEGVNAIFYALEGGATIQNTAQLTALVAKTLKIKNEAVLNYDEGLASASFSSGPGGSWAIRKGTYHFK